MPNSFSLLELLLVPAALGHFVTIPALAVASRLGILERADLRKLLPINERIVLVVLATIQWVLLSSGFTVLWSRADLVRGGRLAAATGGSLAVMWLGRLLVQVILYGPLFKDRLRKLLHWGLVALFAFMAAVYAIACVHAIAAR